MLLHPYSGRETIIQFVVALLVSPWMSKCKLKIVGSCCCNAVPSKVCGVSFAVKVVVLYQGFAQKKKLQGFCVYSVFVSFITQLCSPSNVCVEHGHMLCAQLHKFSFRPSPCSAQLFCLHGTLVWLLSRKAYLLMSPDPILTRLVQTNSPVFTPAGCGSVATTVSKRPIFRQTNIQTLVSGK